MVMTDGDGGKVGVSVHEQRGLNVDVVSEVVANQQCYGDKQKTGHDHDEGHPETSQKCGLRLDNLGHAADGAGFAKKSDAVPSALHEALWKHKAQYTSSSSLLIQSMKYLF